MRSVNFELHINHKLHTMIRLADYGVARVAPPGTVPPPRAGDASARASATIARILTARGAIRAAGTGAPVVRWGWSASSPPPAVAAHQST